MKKLLSTAVFLASLGGTASAEGTVSLYNFFEYMPQELLEKFTAETGIDVVMDTYDSNEAMLASLKAGKLGQYDIAVPVDFMVKVMADEGFLDAFTPDELPNYANIQDQWLDVPFDPGRQYSIPYQWGTTSYAVNRDQYTGPIDSLSAIFEPPAELEGRINVLDSQNEVLTLGSLYLGIEQCTDNRDDLKQLHALLLDAKPAWASFGSDIAKEVLVSGEAAAGMIYNGFSLRARSEGANVEYAYPKEGLIVWMDNAVLLKDAPNREGALKFLNFLLEPENAATLTNYAAYISGVKGVQPFLDETLATSPENNPPEDATAPVFVEACDQETQQLYDAIWTNLKK